MQFYSLKYLHQTKLMKNLLAVGQNIGNKFEGIGAIGLEGGTGDPVTGFASIISSVIGILTMIAAIYFLFIIDARKKITVGVIGLVIAIAAIFITDLVAWLLGINGILNFGEMLNKISPPA
jgi:hypothetical protein